MKSEQTSQKHDRRYPLHATRAESTLLQERTAHDSI